MLGDDAKRSTERAIDLDGCKRHVEGDRALAVDDGDCGLGDRSIQRVANEARDADAALALQVERLRGGDDGHVIFAVDVP